MGKIRIISDSVFEIFAADGTPASAALRSAGIAAGSCGGMGICQKCLVRLIEGSIDAPAADPEGFFPLCRAVIRGDAVLCAAKNTLFSQIVICDDKKHGIIPNSSCPGVAVDVGTTTIEAELFDLNTGHSLGLMRMRNPLSPMGCDVMALISSAASSLSSMTEILRSGINTLICRLCGNVRPCRTVLAGNTVITHILRGADPTPLGFFPYTPSVTGSFSGNGDEIGIFSEKVLVLPCISAFIGGDITAGIIAEELDKTAEISFDNNKSVMLCDLGTNGELVLASCGKLRAASAAAGPAFEGGGISCGTVRLDGSCVIEHVGIGIENGKTVIVTSPKAEHYSGICGSAVVDTVAVMRRLGIIDRDGTFADKSLSDRLPEDIRGRIRGDRFYLTENVFFSQKDVRSFQLAHSAVKCAAYALTGNSQPDEILISGNFGSAASAESLCCLGTLPLRSTDCKIRSCGNTSLRGAGMILLDPSLLLRAEKIVAKTETEELNSQAEFGNDFIKNLSL